MFTSTLTGCHRIYLFLGYDRESVDRTSRDTEFTMSAGRLVNDCQKLFQSQSVYRAQSDAGSTAVAAIVINDE